MQPTMYMEIYCTFYGIINLIFLYNNGYRYSAISFSHWVIWCTNTSQTFVYPYGKYMYMYKLLMTNLNLDVVTVTIIIIILWMCSNDIERNPGPTNILHRDLEWCHLNIQSLKNNTEKMTHIEIELAKQFDIITLSESWLSAENNNSKYKLRNFHPIFRRDRPHERGAVVWRPGFRIDW